MLSRRSRRRSDTRFRFIVFENVFCWSVAIFFDVLGIGCLLVEGWPDSVLLDFFFWLPIVSSQLKREFWLRRISTSGGKRLFFTSWTLPDRAQIWYESSSIIWPSLVKISSNSAKANTFYLGASDIRTPVRHLNTPLYTVIHSSTLGIQRKVTKLPCFWCLVFRTQFQHFLGGFLAIFFYCAVSSCVYDHNHPHLVSERLFLAESKTFPYPRRARAHSLFLLCS